MCANCQELNKPMYYLWENEQEPQTCYALLRVFPRLCGGFQEGSGKIGTRWIVPEHQTPHGRLETSYTLLTCKLLQFPNQERFHCLRKRGVMAHFPHGFWLQAPRRLQRVGVRVCCVYVSVCLYLERMSVKSKGPNHTRCGTENQQRQSGQPHPGSMHWKW